MAYALLTHTRSINPIVLSKGYFVSKKVVRRISGDYRRVETPFKLSQVAASVGTALMLGSVAVQAQEAQKAQQGEAQAASNGSEVQSLETVTVRSRPRLARLQEAPEAISVVSGADLSKELARDLNAITSRFAGITFNQSNTRGANLSIRGLGKRGFNEFQDPSVLVTVDDVSYALTQLGNFDFYDVDQVSVQRGPQGTSGGKGASAGSINITSKGPSFTPSGSYSLTYGQRETLIANATYTGPIVDDVLAWRGAFTVNRGQGYYQNVSNDKHTLSLYNTDRLAGRTQFLLTPSNDLRALLTIEVEPRTSQLQNGLSENVSAPLKYGNGVWVDAGVGNSTLGSATPRAIFNGFTDNNGTFHGPREWFTNNPNFNYNRDFLNTTTRFGNVNFDETQGQVVGYKGSSLKVDKTLDNGSTVSSISAWRQYSFDARNDEGTPFDVAKYGGGGVYYSQFSQELRLTSEAGKPLEYATGLYFINTRNQVESHASYGSDAGAWYANSTQYETLYTPADTSLRGAGRALLADSVNGVYTRQDTDIKTRSRSWFGNIKARVDDQITLNSGLRATWENRHQDYDSFLDKQGAGWALSNYATTRGYALGGFNSNASGALLNAQGQALTGQALANAQALANSLTQQYYGKNWTDLQATLADPAASAAAKAQAQAIINQINAAKGIRSGRIGALISGATSDYNSRLLGTANFSPTYKFNDQVTGYVTWQYGEKSGAPNVVNGKSIPVKVERTQDYEVGFKSNLFDKTLILNAGLFLMNIHNYQQTVRVVDDFATNDDPANPSHATKYTSTQGNAELVRSKGLELDAVYSGVKNTTLRAEAAYNDARYVKFKNAGFPVELAYLSSNSNPFYDASGQTLAGAPKYVLNVGAEYRLPVFNNKAFHASFNTEFKSSYNNDEALSAYSIIPKGSVTDVTIGLGHIKNQFDWSLTVKNVFDDHRHEDGWTSYEPTPYRRWVGITFTGEL